MDALRRASAFLFYLLGTLTIVAIVFVQKNILAPELSIFLNVIDLPLLLLGILFGGTTLITSLCRGKVSPVLAVVVFLPLLAAFAFFAYLNFGLPFPEF